MDSFIIIIGIDKQRLAIWSVNIKHNKIQPAQSALRIPNRDVLLTQMEHNRTVVNYIKILRTNFCTNVLWKALTKRLPKPHSYKNLYV